MKLFEVTVTREQGQPNRITIRREAEERLTGTQKFHVIMALIGAAALIAGLRFIGWKALLGALGAFLMFGFYRMTMGKTE